MNDNFYKSEQVGDKLYPIYADRYFVLNIKISLSIKNLSLSVFLTQQEITLFNSFS